MAADRNSFPFLTFYLPMETVGMVIQVLVDLLRYLWLLWTVPVPPKQGTVWLFLCATLPSSTRLLATTSGSHNNNNTNGIQRKRREWCSVNTWALKVGGRWEPCCSCSRTMSVQVLPLWLSLTSPVLHLADQSYSTQLWRMTRATTDVIGPTPGHQRHRQRPGACSISAKTDRCG